MPDDVLAKFDLALKAMQEKVALLRNKRGLDTKVKILIGRRGELAAAIREENEAAANKVLTDAIALGDEIDKAAETDTIETVTVTKKAGFLETVFGVGRAAPAPAIPPAKGPAAIAAEEKEKREAAEKPGREAEEKTRREAEQAGRGATEKVRAEKPKREVAEEKAEAPAALIRPSPREAVEKARERIAKIEEKHAQELADLSRKLAEREMELEGVKGAYAKIAGDLAGARVKLEEKQATDTAELRDQIEMLKKSFEEMHSTMAREFEAEKDSYQSFGIELMNAAVKIAEIEDRLLKHEEVEDVDVWDLKEGLHGLEKRLARLDAEEKTKRAELLDSMQKQQGELARLCYPRADAEKTLAQVEQRLAEWKREVDEREARVAGRTHEELKKSYEEMSTRIAEAQKAVANATAKDLTRVRGRLEALGKQVEELRQQEIAVSKELEHERAIEDAIRDRLDHLEERVQRVDSSDADALNELWQALEALDFEVDEKLEGESRLKKQVEAIAGVLSAKQKKRIGRGAAQPAAGKAKRAKKARKKKGGIRLDRLFGRR
jgi:chromosome segregation ATPase